MFELFNALFDELYPLPRSLTGPGYEASLSVLGRYVPFEYLRVPSGTPVFDWIVPPRWECAAATLTAPDGTVLADNRLSNLHVVNYSEAVDGVFSLEELQPHLHSLPDLPEAIPYVTSYYNRQWGFCLPHAVRERLAPGEYRAKIDSVFSPGEILIGEAVLPGESSQEILLTSYLCHPSMANNELSGPLALLGLYLKLGAWKRRRFTYRFVINPETIGALCYLYLRGDHLRANLAAGFVLTCLGGPVQRLSYKRSRRGDSLADRLAARKAGENELQVRPFTPAFGSDERQYCSPGFNLPMGLFARTAYNEYAGYHNSLDTKQFMDIGALLNSVAALESFLRELDAVGAYENLRPFGEPQLGKRRLYPAISSTEAWKGFSVADNGKRVKLEEILYVLNYSDTQHDLLDISELSGLPAQSLAAAAEALEGAGLLRFIGTKRSAR